MKDKLLNFHNVQFETSAGKASQLIKSDLPEIVFSGKSNVGKSSVINKLLNRKSLARVSATPGKTTTVNFFRLDKVRFVDLPGYGYAKVSHDEKLRWSELVEGYFNSQRNIKMVLQLLDMRHPPTREDINMLNFLEQLEIPYMLILTKADKLNKTQTQQRLEAFEQELSFIEQEILAVPFSAVRGDGADEVRRIISELILNPTDEDEQ